MIKCWLVFLAVRYRVIFDFFEFVLRMNEVISLNVVFLNLFQRKLRCEVHMDALFFQFFWIYLFEHTRSQFFVKRCWNEQRFRNHSVNFGIVLEKCEVFEDDTPHCLSVWKTQKTIFAVWRWVLWPLDRDEAGSDLVFFANRPVFTSKWTCSRACLYENNTMCR